MRYIEEQLQREKKILEDEIKKVKKRCRNNIPQGSILVKQKGRRIEYYYRKSTKKQDDMPSLGKTKESPALDNRKAIYIKKENLGLVKQMIQRDYDDELIHSLHERIRVIEGFLKKYKSTNIQRIYEKTNIHKRALLDDAVLSDEEYVKRWEDVSYEGKSFTEDAKEIYSDRGERVRSKSEKIIADRLQVLGIPYRYEYPLKLKDSITVYPDFTLLNIDTREEIYLEHCGLMDDSNYVENLMFKLKSYEKNGIYLGVNLFITYETARFPFQTKVLDELLKKLFSVSKHDF